MLRERRQERWPRANYKFILYRGKRVSSCKFLSANAKQIVVPKWSRRKSLEIYRTYLEDLFRAGNLNVVFIASSSPFYGSFPGIDRKSFPRSILIFFQFLKLCLKMRTRWCDRWIRWIKFVSLCCARILRSFYKHHGKVITSYHVQCTSLLKIYRRN